MGALCQSFSGTHVPTPFQLGDEIWIANMRRGVAMTFKAPAHAEPFVLVDGFHGVDTTVAFDATDTTRNVCRVIEEGVVGHVVDLDPLHGHAGLITLMQRSKLLALGMNLRMAVHARCRRRNSCNRRILDRVVAVPAIDAQFTCMQSMAEGNRLGRHVPHVRRCRTEAPGHHERHVQWRSHTHDDDHREDEIRPSREGVLETTHGVSKGVGDPVKTL